MCLRYSFGIYPTDIQLLTYCFPYLTLENSWRTVGKQLEKYRRNTERSPKDHWDYTGTATLQTRHKTEDYISAIAER